MQQLFFSLKMLIRNERGLFAPADVERERLELLLPLVTVTQTGETRFGI